MDEATKEVLIVDPVLEQALCPHAVTTVQLLSNQRLPSTSVALSS